jgi:RNA polymerase sigma factor (sigma-70 family)
LDDISKLASATASPGGQLSGARLRAQPDSALVALCRRGDQAAFAEVDRRYRGRLLSYARSFVGDDRAEDVLQDALLNASRAIAADERALHLRAWLYRIVRNTALNALRDAPPRHDQLDESIDGTGLPLEELERRGQLRRLVASIKELPRAQREAIVRRELGGEGLAEIGESMGKTRGAVGLLLFRARAALRESWSGVLPAALLRLSRLAPGQGGVRGLALVGTDGGSTLSQAAVALVIVGATLGGAGKLAGTAHDHRAGAVPGRAASAKSLATSSAKGAASWPAASGATASSTELVGARHVARTGSGSAAGPTAAPEPPTGGSTSGPSGGPEGDGGGGYQPPPSGGGGDYGGAPRGGYQAEQSSGELSDSGGAVADGGDRVLCDHWMADI